MTSRTPAQYDWTNALFNDRRITKHFTHPRRSKISHVTLHHMDSVSSGSDAGNTAVLEGCYKTWMGSREASANYGVAGDQVWQFVSDGDAPWADANSTSNHSTLAIEHADSTGDPTYKIDAKTMATGQRLVATLHHLYGLGRPTRSTVKVHRDFYATACPGPYMMAHLDEYIAAAGKIYDGAKPVESAPPVATPPAKVVPTWNQPETWKVGGVSADVKRLAERLVVHGFEDYYGNGTDTTFSLGEDVVAVRAFQTAQGWTGSDADGYPGLQTFALLEADPPAAKPAVTKPALRPARATGAAPAKIPSSMSKMYHVASNVWYAVEDSIYGLEAAEAGGYPWADIDIHVTKDGVMVCGHDTSPSDDHFVISAAFKKKYGSHPNIENMTWADVSTLRTPPTKFAGQTITLRYYKVDEILAWMGEHPKMSVSFELKQSLAFEQAATFEALRDAAVAHGVDPKRLAVMSIARPAYDHLARFKAAHSYFPTMVLPHDLAKPSNWASVQPYVDYYRGSWA